jgi:hypothetical protein
MMTFMVRSSVSPFRLSMVALIVAAIGFGGVLASIIVDDGEAVASRDAPVNVAVAAPAPAARLERFAPPIPAELLIAPKSLPDPVAMPAAQPEVTGSVAPTASVPTASVPTGPAPISPVPLPRKRVEPKADAKPDPNRGESASAQLARIKATLKLTPAQEAYWPPVEAALRDILTQLGYDSGQLHRTQAAKRPTTPPAIDQERVQRLTSAAMPLLMTFDEAQKSEVRRLARIMGLENVASAI